MQHGLKKLVAYLNTTYKIRPALYKYEIEPQGFEWIDCNDREHSILSYLRKNDEELIIAIFNFTPVPRDNYRLGVPELGEYEIIINSDSEYYAGSNYHNPSIISAEQTAWSDRPYSIQLNLTPLSGLILQKNH